MKTAFGTFESYAQEISRLRAENEELRWRIDGLLGTGQICAGCRSDARPVLETHGRGHGGRALALGGGTLGRSGLGALGRHRSVLCLDLRDTGTGCAPIAA